MDKNQSDIGIRLLADAGRVIGSGHDERQMLAQIGRLVAGNMAEYVVTGLSAADHIDGIAVASRDGGHKEDLEQAVQSYADSQEICADLYQLARGGSSLFAPEITNEWLGAGTSDPEQRRRIRRLGIRSGALVFTRNGSAGQGFILAACQAEGGLSESYLKVLEEVMQRAGAAMDNAVLYEEALRAKKETEEKAMEVIRVNKLLEEEIKEAGKLAEIADRASRAKTDFLTIMGHELRTPLNIIAGYADLLATGIQGELNEGQGLYISKIQASEKHLLGLVENILDFTATADAKDSGVESVGTIMEDLAAETKVLAVAKNIEIRYDKTKQGALVSQGSVVREILRELLVNAVKFTDEGWVMTYSEAEGDVTKIIVADSGVGIIAGAEETIFEPFVQLAGALTRAQGGIGLGLARARQKARRLRGDIKVSRGETGGALFILELPIYLGDGPE